MASRAATFVSAGVLALHLVAGGAALVLLPRGFAVDDIHLWSNTVIPALASLAVVASLIALAFRRAAEPTRLLVAAAAGGWISTVVTGAALFPSSMPLARCALPALVALVLLALAAWSNARSGRSFGALAVGGALGLVVIFAQRAPLPSTLPAGGTLAVVAEAANDEGSGQVVVPCGTHQLRVYPLLTFTSRSPDRTWTVLSPDAHGSRRHRTRYEKTLAGFRAAFTDDGESTLVANADANGDVDIEAVTTLHAPVYSHLNAFTSIELSFDATLSFGPTGSTRFPIEPADYPSGRPSHLAYLDESLAFHVARADDAEKGPFSELGAGRLARREPLVLELRPRDDRDRGCRLVFSDWPAQVSTEPSPTAGWGVPQGSIQFFKSGGTGLVLLTLADTGPGRGFDSVGHAAGTYRNRLRIEAIR